LVLGKYCGNTGVGGYKPHVTNLDNDCSFTIAMHAENVLKIFIEKNKSIFIDA
jgi:hypothetical protein